MKKILVVFLLFVSFNLFAQQKEIGRFNIELRDYDREDEILCNEETAWTIQKPYELHLKHTFDYDNDLIKRYFKTWIKNADYIDYNYLIVYRYYQDTEMGRHKPSWELFSYSFLRQWSFQERRSLETEAAQLAQKMSEESGDKYTVEFSNVYTQEYSWIGIKPITTDENGEKYYSFKAVFIFYVEAL